MELTHMDRQDGSIVDVGDKAVTRREADRAPARCGWRLGPSARSSAGSSKERRLATAHIAGIMACMDL